MYPDHSDDKPFDVVAYLFSGMDMYWHDLDAWYTLYNTFRYDFDRIGRARLLAGKCHDFV